MRIARPSILTAWAFLAICQPAAGDAIYTVDLDTTSLVGHPAGPFYFEAAFTDGSGYGDGNNTVTIGDLNFGGGSALGNPFTYGGASGSLETGVEITDSSFLGLFSEAFAPGLQLSFSLGVTSNDDGSGIPDGLTFFILDSSGVALPTLAPVGDYFLSAALGSGGPVFSAYGSDPNRAPTEGDPVSIPAPSITSASSVPEPSTLNFAVIISMAMLVLGRLRFGSRAWRL